MTRCLLIEIQSRTSYLHALDSHRNIKRSINSEFSIWQKTWELDKEMFYCYLHRPKAPLRKLDSTEQGCVVEMGCMAHSSNQWHWQPLRHFSKHFTCFVFILVWYDRTFWGEELSTWFPTELENKKLSVKREGIINQKWTFRHCFIHPHVSPKAHLPQSQRYEICTWRLTAKV